MAEHQASQQSVLTKHTRSDSADVHAQYVVHALSLPSHQRPTGGSPMALAAHMRTVLLFALNDKIVVWGPSLLAVILRFTHNWELSISVAVLFLRGRCWLRLVSQRRRGEHVHSVVLATAMM